MYCQKNTPTTEEFREKFYNDIEILKEAIQTLLNNDLFQLIMTIIITIIVIWYTRFIILELWPPK